MSARKKNPKSQRSRDAFRILLALIPLPFALSLLAFPELGDFSLVPLLGVFAFGVLVGTITHIYWLRVLLRERRFYKKFYEESALKPHKVDVEMHKKHTRILLPFYIFSVLVFIIILFVLGLSNLDFSYILPLGFGALEGVPISYYLLERGVFS